MKFKVDLPQECQELLETEYRDYVKNNPLNRKERQALLEWVKTGHGVHENPAGAWYDGGVPLDFITVWRDEEYIRINTVGKSTDHVRKFYLDYYGWDDEPPVDYKYVPPRPGMPF